MALTKRNEIAQIIFEPQTGHLFVKRRMWIEDDGVQITSDNVHRDSFVPGQDLSDHEAVVQAAAAFFWTPDVMAACEARQAAQQMNSGPSRTVPR
jgi:monoamine oxidase